MKMGDTIYIKREFYRAYGDNRLDPMYPWDSAVIDGETSRSWIIYSGQSYREQKIPKTGRRLAFMLERTLCLSEGDILRKFWVDNNRHKIGDRVRRVDDHDALRAIEKILDDLVMVEVGHVGRNV